MNVPASAPVLATLVAAFGFLATGHSALAGETASSRYDARTVTVRYGDLDLAKPAGVEALYNRLRVAARKVCGTAAGRDLRDNMVVRQCHRDSLDRAVADIGLAALAVRHQGSVRRMATLAR